MYAKTQRSHFAPGYFVAPEWVVTEDFFLPAAQIAGVTVGDRPATIERRFPDRKAMLLRVAGAPHAPLKMAAGKPAYAASANPQAMIRNRLLAPARAEPPSGAPARLVPGRLLHHRHCCLTRVCARSVFLLTVRVSRLFRRVRFRSRRTRISRPPQWPRRAVHRAGHVGLPVAQKGTCRR
jgi:hypothetical protein